MDLGRIKFVDSEGLRRIVLVRKNSQTAITFDCFTNHVWGVFDISNKVRLKYLRDGEIIVVDDEVGWEETSMSLKNQETLNVVLERLNFDAKLLECDDYKGEWEQIGLNSLNSFTTV